MPPLCYEWSEELRCEDCNSRAGGKATDIPLLTSGVQLLLFSIRKEGESLGATHPLV